jgi:hypothetical protein
VARGLPRLRARTRQPARASTAPPARPTLVLDETKATTTVATRDRVHPRAAVGSDGASWPRRAGTRASNFAVPVVRPPRAWPRCGRGPPPLSGRARSTALSLSFFHLRTSGQPSLATAAWAGGLAGDAGGRGRAPRCQRARPLVQRPGGRRDADWRGRVAAALLGNELSSNHAERARGRLLPPMRPCAHRAQR